MFLAEKLQFLNSVFSLLPFCLHHTFVFTEILQPKFMSPIILHVKRNLTNSWENFRHIWNSETLNYSTVCWLLLATVIHSSLYNDTKLLVYQVTFVKREGMKEKTTTGSNTHFLFVCLLLGTVKCTFGELYYRLTCRAANFIHWFPIP